MKTNAFSFFNSEVATRFENNFRKQHPGSSVIRFLSSSGLSPDMIESAFSWKDTPEGTEYWRTIDILWKEFLEGKRGPLPEDLDVEEVGLQKRLGAKLKEAKPSPEAVMKEFRSLFGGKVYESFKRNLETDSDQYGESQNLLTFLKDRIAVSGVGTMVGAAFRWRSTPEGDKYWKHIHETWKSYWRTKTGVQED